EGTAVPQSILFPPEKICLRWQQRQGAGAGLQNLGNTCFLNSVLQCLTYTPPLANYLLSGEHSRSCRQQGFCMMCIMEAHVTQVLRSSGSTIEPWAVVGVLPRIGEHFQLGMQEDAHEFLRYTVDAMQTACLSGSSQGSPQPHLDGFLHKLLINVWARAFPHPECPPFSLLQEAPSVTAALKAFVEPELLDAFKCSKYNEMAAASKGFTVHGAPVVLTVFLKRCDDFTGRKITQLVKYPENLDLRPYTSQAAGEPLLYALYAVLVHRGDSCREGHYFCYTKASNGRWYKMDDESVHGCRIGTVLRQQAYLLFYVR
ncbi:Ubiquitin carboxyl-terminal hydrolase 42, partial [Egretta garzetta]